MGSIVRHAAVALAMSAAVSVAAPASAANINFTAQLTAAEVVPPTNSPGKGTFTAIYGDISKRLNGTLTFEGLTGEVTSVTFHAGRNTRVDAAGLTVPAEVTGPEILRIEGPFTSPHRITVTLTPEQAAEFEKAGSPRPVTDPGIGITTLRGQTAQVYMQVNTAANPNGEIRGQLICPQVCRP